MQTRVEFDQLDLIQSPVFVLEVAFDGTPTYVAFNSFGLDVAKRPLSDFIGRTAQQVYGGAFGKTALTRHRHVAQHSEPMVYELTLPLAGDERQVRTTLTPVTDDTGRVTLIYGSTFDISAERRAAELEVSLQTLNTEVEQFVSMAAHDLRAPMRNVSALADMMRDDFVDHGDGQIDLLDMLDDVSKKAMGLISDVLAHANATTTKASIKTFRFHDLCREICDILDPRGSGTYQFTKAEVHTDHAVLQIALRNIIENAIKNCTDDHLRLDITMTQQTDAMLQVQLSDNGSGFSASALKFFDNGDFRVDSGYGLLGVKRLLNTRGGTISAHNNTQNGGGVVEFSLPGTLNNEGISDQESGLIDLHANEAKPICAPTTRINSP